MKLKSILFSLLACTALTAMAQPTQQAPDWEWYLDQVVGETFVGRNYFEFYYLPSAADMRQQREKGEVTYFLNSPEGLNSKKVRNMIDRLMASYDDIKAVGEWHMTSNTYWKEFRYEKNKFRFSIKRKALDDGTYYVSVTETAGYYKSLAKKEDKGKQTEVDESAPDKPVKRSSHRRKKVVIEDDEGDAPDDAIGQDDAVELASTKPVVSEKQRRREARQREVAEREAQRLREREAKEKERAQVKAEKEALKAKKAEEKKKKAEEKKKEAQEKKRRKEEEKLQREQERREQELARKQAAAPKPVESRYHYTDVALWLSEKYDFTQIAASESSCTMFSTAVTEVEMAKLAIKNALKGSNARMAVPWRVNNESQAVETGYTVDGHVLVFAIGKDKQGRITLTVTEVSQEQFELFKQSM